MPASSVSKFVVDDDAVADDDTTGENVLTVLKHNALRNGKYV